MQEFVELVIYGVMTGSVYALIALAFTLIYKSTGILNFAQGEFVMVGSFIFWTFLIQFGLPLWASIVLIFVAAGLIGFLAQRLFLQPLIGQPLLSAILITMALSAMLSGMVAWLWGGLVRGYPGLLPVGGVHIGEIIISKQYLFAFVACIVLLGIFMLIYQRSKLGLAMRSVAEDHQVSRSLGIDVKKIFTISWVLASIVSAVAGILFGSLFTVSQEMSTLGLRALPAVLLGGLESLYGAVIGGIIIGVVEKLASGYLNPLVGGGIEVAFTFMVMVIIVMIRPYGLFGLKKIERV